MMPLCIPESNHPTSAAKDSSTGEQVAIKKVRCLFIFTCLSYWLGVSYFRKDDSCQESFTWSQATEIL